MEETNVKLYTNCQYDESFITEKILRSGLLNGINSGMKVVLKPNLVQQSRDQDDDWDYVITHPVVITSVINIVLKKLNGNGEIVIADAPMTPTRFEKLLEHYPVELWKRTGLAFLLLT